MSNGYPVPKELPPGMSGYVLLDEQLTESRALAIARAQLLIASVKLLHEFDFPQTMELQFTPRDADEPSLTIQDPLAHTWGKKSDWLGATPAVKMQCDTPTGMYSFGANTVGVWPLDEEAPPKEGRLFDALRYGIVPPEEGLPGGAIALQRVIRSFTTDPYLSGPSKVYRPAPDLVGAINRAAKTLRELRVDNYNDQGSWRWIVNGQLSEEFGS